MRYRSCLVALSSILVAACGGSEAPSGETGPHALPPIGDGKTDNYISTNAREFLLTGIANATLPEGFDALEGEAREAALTAAVESRLGVVSRSVRSHIDSVVRAANDGQTGEDAKWFTYARRDAALFEGAEVLEGGRARLDFEIELVGSTRLMSLLAPDDATERTFEVVVKDYGETEGEAVAVQIAGSDSRDAFPRYDALFEDGVLDIAVHFGGDYNSERNDLDTARWLVATLLEDGWTNEGVTTFEELGIDSPPFTRAITIEGRPMRIEVRLFHSDMVEATDEARLSDVMKQSLAERDIVIYSGHAGEGAGFILDYQPRHEIRASEFATVEMADKYQIFVLDGCRTYRTYVDDLLKNPAKTFDNLDVITTVNTTPFAVGYQVLFEFVYWLTLTDADGNHFPISWMDVLRGVNTESFDSVHYGVHGIDQDPQLNPHASEGVACTPCTTDAECAAGGNLCLGYPAGAGCGVACTTDTACPDGYRCARLFDDDDVWYIPKQCVRRDYTCP